MLYLHTAHGQVIPWQIGLPRPYFEPAKIITIQADGRELTWLKTSYYNLPILDGRTVHVWSGEWATRIAQDFAALNTVP